MSSSKEYLKFVLDKLSKLDDIEYKAMMGEFIIYYKNKIVGGIYDDRFLIKPVKAAIELIPDPIYEIPYQGAKKMILIDDIDDKEHLARLFESMYNELPTPKVKMRKTKN